MTDQDKEREHCEELNSAHNEGYARGLREGEALAAEKWRAFDDLCIEELKDKLSVAHASHEQTIGELQQLRIKLSALREAVDKLVEDWSRRIRLSQLGAYTQLSDREEAAYGELECCRDDLRAALEASK